MKGNLSDLLRTKETTVSGVLYDQLKKNNVFTSNVDNYVYGIRDVKENLLSAIFKAKILSENGYVPLVLLIGPSGSGKSELINFLNRSYYEAIKNDSPLYTLNINGVECPHKENPFDILSDALPFEIELPDKGYQRTERRRPRYLCESCTKNLEKMLKDRQDQRIFLSDNNLGFSRIFPSEINMELNDKKLPDNFYKIANNANRGILLITADRTDILSGVSKRTYQFLSNLYDNNLTDLEGNRLPLDMLGVIHGNEQFFSASNDEEDTFSEPLRERLIRVDIRRNLSFSEEEKIYNLLKIPFEKMFPNALRYISILNVLSRVNDSMVSANNKEVYSMLSLLDIYDSGKSLKSDFYPTTELLEFVNVDEKTQTAKLDDLVKKKAFEIIIDRDQYKSGWSVGVSARGIYSLLKDGEKTQLSFSDFGGYINLLELDPIYGITAEKKNYINDLIVSDIRGTLDIGILSFLMKKEDKPFEYYVRVIEEGINSLLNPLEAIKPNAVEVSELSSARETISKYVDLKRIENKEAIQTYARRTFPNNGSGRIKFDEYLKFLYFENSARFEPDKPIILPGLAKGDVLYNTHDISDMRKYLKDYTAKNFGYWDRCFEDAMKIHHTRKIYDD